MAHVGTITGSMVLDPSAYIAGLNRAAQHTAAFQSSIQAGTAGINAFAKASQSMAVGMSRLNGSVYASMTAFYALSRVVSSSLGVFEEYNNIIARISATADLSINSVTALSESFKKLNRELGGSRTDLMKGVYRAVQANFTTPGEFMPIGAAAMRLRTASGREINTTQSADVISVIRNALGIKSGREGFITDMLLRGRDIGRYELTEMASALGIPITVFGNQFSAKLGPEETLRQLIAILSSATQTGLSPRTAATGMRRMIQKTSRMAAAPEGIGKNLTRALQGMGYGSISEALNESPMALLHNLSALSGGRQEILTRLGFGDRESMLLASALRNNMGQTRDFHNKLAAGEIGGTTDKYLDRHKQTWWHQRDRLRSAYLDSQLKLMEAMIPVMSSFANSLEVVNDLFQALAPSIKRLIGLMTIGAGFSILRNFYVRSGGGVGGGHNSFAMSPPRLENFGRIGPDFFSRGIRKPVIGTPAQRTYGNQIYGGSGNVFGIAHPSYYGGGISSVGWRPLDSNNAQGQLIPIIPMSQNIMPYNIQNLNRKYNSAFMNPNAKHLNRVQIKSKPFSEKAEQQRAIDLYNWNLQREALIAQIRARSQMLRDKYVKMQKEHYAWGPERNAFGGPKYILRPVSYTLPPIKPTLGTHLATNKDWMPRSALFNAVRNNISTFPERMLDRVGGAAMWASNALNNLPSYGSIPGMTSAIKAGAFMFGGQDYRIERIQDKYNSRIAAANEALKSGTMSAHRNASGLYKTLTGAGMGDMRAAGEAANYLNKALNDVNKKFNETAASAQRSARNMSGVASAFSTLGSVANMAKIGVIIKVISDLINGFNLSEKSSKHADVVDLSKAGTEGGKLFDLNDIFRRWSDDIKYAGAFLLGYANLKTKSELTDLIMPDVISRRASLGYVLNEDYNPKGFGFGLGSRPIADRLFRPATLEDAMKTAFRENLSPKEQTKLTKAGYKELTPKVQREFEDYLMSGKLGQKYTGVTEPGWGQRTNIEEFEGKSGHQVRIDLFTSFLKEMSRLDETIKKTTSSVKSFNMTAKQTDHIVEYLKNNYRAYFSIFSSGAKQIETRGMLYDQQADRSLTPNEQSIWQSSGYREKMALAASDLFTPKHRFGDEGRFASFEDWVKQEKFLDKKNEIYSGFDKYEDAKRNYFEASSNEQTASMLAVLLPKLSMLSRSDARKQLEGIYGRNLNLDDVGIDRLRNIDLSRYFSEKPRDQLNSKSQFMSYGTTETYNSIVSMTPPEIIELQANRQAILDLQERITQNTDELLQDFDDKFEKFVADKLDKIVDNTAAISASVAEFGNTPDFVSSLDHD